MPIEATDHLARLLREVADAHHRTFASTIGEDPGWARWHAGEMAPRLAGTEFLPMLPAGAGPRCALRG